MKNTYRKTGDIIEIAIKRRTETVYAIIDAEDLEKVFAFKRWRILVGRGKCRYVVAHPWDDPKAHVLLHRLLKDVPEGKQTHCINANPLDCRKLNWVIAENRSQISYAHQCDKTKHIRLEDQRYVVEFRKKGQEPVRKSFGLLADAIEYRDDTLRKLRTTLRKQAKKEEMERSSGIKTDGPIA